MSVNTFNEMYSRVIMSTERMSEATDKIQSILDMLTTEREENAALRSQLATARNDALEDAAREVSRCFWGGFDQDEVSERIRAMKEKDK